MFLASELRAVFAVAGGHHAKALELERVLQAERDVRLVVDDEDGLLGFHPYGRVYTKRKRRRARAGRRRTFTSRVARYASAQSSVTAAPRHAMKATAPLAGVGVP